MVIVVSWQRSLNPGFLDELVSLSPRTKLLILGGLVVLGLPKSIITLLNVRKVFRAPGDAGSNKAKWATKAFLHASGFEIICVLGLASFLLGFHTAWAVGMLLAGTLCKLAYARPFMKLRALAEVEAASGQPVARGRRTEDEMREA